MKWSINDTAATLFLFVAIAALMRGNAADALVMASLGLVNAGISVAFQ